MKVLKLLVLVAAVALAVHWWKGRGERVEAATKSPNGFVSVVTPDGARPNTVIIFAPLNCRSEVAQRADMLSNELNSRRIPNVRSDSYTYKITNPTERDDAAVRRTTEVINGGALLVFINGRAKADPLLAEIIAEYNSGQS